MFSIGTIAKEEAILSNSAQGQLGAMTTSELRLYAFSLFSAILDKTSPEKEKNQNFSREINRQEAPKMRVALGKIFPKIY